MAELTPEKIAELTSKLVALRSTLQEELASLSESARPVDLGEPIGRLTRIDALQQQQMAMASRDRIRNRLQAIAAALRRIDTGNYGECLRCGEDVEPGRLEARPETFLCRSCQQGRETAT
jgi:DnaK suppressor protein